MGAGNSQFQVSSQVYIRIGVVRKTQQLVYRITQKIKTKIEKNTFNKKLKRFKFETVQTIFQRR